MNVEILDDEMISQLIPLEIQRYLLANHWQEIYRKDGVFSIWENTGKSGDKLRVWLPLDVTLGDYSVAVGRLIRTISQAENRSQLQLIEDLH